jgi:hypothetical protein
MLSNYLKIAFRNLLRHKGFSFINIFGLGIGMASSILILLWIVEETSYDKFHKDSGNIFRITASLPELNINAAVSSCPLAQAFSREVPEIQKAVRLHGDHTELLQVGDVMFEEKQIFYADSNFFQFFTFPLKAGDPTTALRQPESIVITEAIAKKYFGNEDAIGKVIRMNHKDDFTVTGILPALPEN